MKKKLVLGVLMVAMLSTVVGCSNEDSKDRQHKSSRKSTKVSSVNVRANGNDDDQNVDNDNVDDDTVDGDIIDDDDNVDDDIDMSLLMGDYEQVSGDYYLNGGLVSIDEDYVTVSFEGISFDSYTTATYLGDDTVEVCANAYDANTDEYEPVVLLLEYTSGGELCMTVDTSYNSYFEEGDVLFFEEY